MIHHLSYSSIMTWYTCPRLWWLNYEKRIPQEGSKHFAFGTAAHRVIQEGALGGSQRRTFTYFAQVYTDELNKQGIELTLDSQELKTAEALLSNEMVNHILDGMTVSNADQIERKVEFYAPGVPIPIIGYIDLLLDNGVPVDIKTSARDWSEDRAAGELQPLFYLTALNTINDHRHAGRFIHLIVVKDVEDPRAYEIETNFVAGYETEVFDLCTTTWNGIQEKRWEKVPTDSLSQCSHCRDRLRCIEIKK